MLGLLCRNGDSQGAGEGFFLDKSKQDPGAGLGIYLSVYLLLNAARKVLCLLCAAGRGKDRFSSSPPTTPALCK